jgi:cytochrome P450
MTSVLRRIPAGPSEAFEGGRDLFDWMAEQFSIFGNIYRASIYGADAYVVTDPEYARHVLLRNWQNYTRGLHVKRIALLMGRGLIVSEGNFWKRQRQMMQPAFHRRAVDALTGVMVQANTRILKKWQQAAAEGSGIDVTEDVSRMVLEVVLRSLFGADYELVAPHFNLVADVKQRDFAFAHAFQRLGKLIREVIVRRRASGAVAMDMLGMLMHAKDRATGEGMSDAQIVNEIMTLVIAGHETTASTLNWAWYLIARHPEVQERLASEIESLLPGDVPPLEDVERFAYVQQVLEETMRLYPALWLMTRKAIGEDDIGGYFVPRGTEIYVSPYFIQRHPDLWENPERFDPDRFSPGDSEKRRRMMTLPFSVGPRSCIGEYFSRLEMQLHLIMVQKRLRLRYDETKPLQVEAGINLRSKFDFMMTAERRFAAAGGLLPSTLNGAAPALSGVRR